MCDTLILTFLSSQQHLTVYMNTLNWLICHLMALLCGPGGCIQSRDYNPCLCSRIVTLLSCIVPLWPLNSYYTLYLCNSVQTY